MNRVLGILYYNHKNNNHNNNNKNKKTITIILIIKMKTEIVKIILRRNPTIVLVIIEAATIAT